MASIDYMCDVGYAAPPKPFNRRGQFFHCPRLFLCQSWTPRAGYPRDLRPAAVPQAAGLWLAKSSVGALWLL